MKKLLILLCLITILFSCKKDSSGTAPGLTQINADLLAGKWTNTQDTIKNYKNGVLSEQYNTGGYSFDGSYYDKYEKDGTGVAVGPSGLAAPNNIDIVHFTYSLKASLITLNYPAQTVNSFPVSASTHKFTIRTLNSTLLVLFYDETEKKTNGSTIRYTEVSYYKRQ